VRGREPSPSQPLELQCELELFVGFIQLECVEQFLQHGQFELEQLVQQLRLRSIEQLQ
jgi:hypothetical protein